MLPLQKLCGWSHQTEVLVTVYWLARGALYRATADILTMPRATVGRTVKETHCCLWGILVHCWCHSPASRQDSPLGRTTDEMLCENPLCQCRVSVMPRCIFGCLHCQCGILARHACPLQVVFVKTGDVSARWRLSLRSWKKPMPAAFCFNNDPTVSL